MEHLLMSRKERKRLEIYSRVKRGELRLSKAAELLGISYRQAKRSYSRYSESGAAGLVHGLRGRASNRGSDEEQREAVLWLYQEKYGDFGPTLAAEYLSREDGQQVAVTTLRRWLISAGLWSPKGKRSVHRRWRARKEHVGEMVQMDGSYHDWFEGRRAWSVLMVMIDDATGRIYARFFEAETTAAAMEVFQRYVQRYGLPRSLYVDRDSIYKTTRDATADEELLGKEAATQFARAMEELEVELILAHSPQAKGRVERCNGTLQDRLVKALRLAGIDDLESASRYLEESFLAEFNARFAVQPQAKADLHRRVPRNVRLEQVLSFQESRVVQNDWTVCWRHRRFQLTEANSRLALVRQRVTVCEQLDGTIRLLYKGRELVWEEITDRQAPDSAPGACEADEKRGPTGLGRIGVRPAADHPWRRPAIHAPPTPRAARPPCSA
ncbi:MAG: ISNCY family transposase, partial [Bacteroidota bacterium]